MCGIFFTGNFFAVNILRRIILCFVIFLALVKIFPSIRKKSQGKEFSDEECSDEELSQAKN
jgi:hypothetical protein